MCILKHISKEISHFPLLSLSSHRVHQLLFFLDLVAFGGLSAFSLNFCLFQRSVAESAKSCNEPQNDIAALGTACAQSWADLADAQFLPDKFSNH